MEKFVCNVCRLRAAHVCIQLVGVPNMLIVVVGNIQNRALSLASMAKGLCCWLPRKCYGRFKVKD
jgi:hypothetical protein